MTDHNDPSQFALSDDQLESLAMGQEPFGEQVHPRNPVAQFFAEARSTRNRMPVGGPQGELAGLFGGRPGSAPAQQGPAPAQQGPAPAQPGPADMGVFSVDPGRQPDRFDEVTLTNAAAVVVDPSVAATQHAPAGPYGAATQHAQADPYGATTQHAQADPYGAVTRHAPAQPPVPERGGGQGLLSDHTNPSYGALLNQKQAPPEPEWGGHGDAGFGGGPNDYGPAEEQHYDLEVNDPYGGPQGMFDSRAPVYRASPIDALVSMVRPSGTKALVAATLVVSALAGSHAVGLINLPLLGSSSEDQQVAGVGVTTSSTPGATSVTDTTDPSRFGAGALDTTSSTETTTSAVTEPDEEPSTSAETTTPPVETPTTPVVAETTTTVEATTTTEAQTTTTEASTTTTTTSTTVPAPVTLAIGATLSVPDQAPAGTYRATADDTCEVTIADADADESTLDFDDGDKIKFTLVDDGTVEVGEGCPTSYAVT